MPNSMPTTCIDGVSLSEHGGAELVCRGSSPSDSWAKITINWEDQGERG